METKDIEQLIEKQGKAYNALIDGLKTELAEVKKGVADPLTVEKLEKIKTDLLKLDEMKTRIDRIETAHKRRAVTDDKGEEIPAERVEHRKAFGQFVRKGVENGLRELEAKALTVASDPDGGYTAPVELDHTITRIVTEISDLRPLAQVMTIGSPSLKKLVNLAGTASGWVGETESRPQTNASNLSALEFPTMELYAMPAATQTLLDDSFVNIEEWAGQEVAIEFAKQEGIAFVGGDGSKKPRGLLSYTMQDVTGTNGNSDWGKVGYMKTGVNGDFGAGTGDNVKQIQQLIHGIKASYRAGASFMANRTTLGFLMGQVNTQGLPLWQPSLQAGVPSLLAGYAVNEVQDVPDVSANGFALGFGNWQRHYLIVDRVGVRILRDPYTVKPYVLFYTTKRVGGGIQMFEAAKWLKFAA